MNDFKKKNITFLQPAKEANVNTVFIIIKKNSFLVGLLVWRGGARENLMS